MARALGLPTRVMVGFTPGQAARRRPVPRRRPSRPRLGRGVVRRLRLGAVRPDARAAARRAPRGTPASRRRRTTATALAAGAVDEQRRRRRFQPPHRSAAAPRTVQRPGAVEHAPVQSLEPTSPTERLRRLDRSSLRSVLGLLAWVVAMPRVLNRWSRHRGRDRRPTASTLAWAATVRSLAMAGAPRSPARHRSSTPRSVDVGKAETVEIARLVTRAVYSPRGVDDSAADRSELLAARSTRRAAAA